MGQELPGGRGLRGAFVLRSGPSGYSTELALWKGVQSLVLGAPRHQHTGKVVIFTQKSRQWQPKAEVTGTQVGCGGARVEPEGGGVSRGGEGADEGVRGSWGEVLLPGERQDLAQKGCLWQGQAG